MILNSSLPICPSLIIRYSDCDVQNFNVIVLSSENNWKEQKTLWLNSLLYKKRLLLKRTAQQHIGDKCAMKWGQGIYLHKENKKKVIMQECTTRKVPIQH